MRQHALQETELAAKGGIEVTHDWGMSKQSLRDAQMRIKVITAANTIQTRQNSNLPIDNENATSFLYITHTTIALMK